LKYKHLNWSYIVVVVVVVIITVNNSQKIVKKIENGMMVT